MSRLRWELIESTLSIFLLLSLFPLAESLALATDVISEKGTDDEIVFWGKTYKRLIDYYSDSVKALFLSEEDIDV